MRTAAALFLLVAAAILGIWWWLGAPVAMPPSPLAAGEKLFCVSYTPFRGNETPLDLTTRIDAAEIEDDLARLARISGCVRTYSTDFGLDRVAEIARRHGMQVIQGAWIGWDPVRNRREVETAITLAKSFPDTIRAVVIGNESLLRGEMAPGDLANLIRSVKARVSVPVTYADVWEFWLRYPSVQAAVDFVTIHILPYWEDFPVPASEAAAHVEDIRQKLKAAFPDKEILIGEVGWPSAGRMRDGALPSPANQARVVHDVLATAKREHYRVSVIEAFDQPWKEHLEGTVGGHWGLLDGKTREFKFAWGAAISDHPYWRWQAGAGIVLAALVFGAALAAQRRERLVNEPMLGRWIGVAATGLAAGVLVGWALANVPIESLGLDGWARSLLLAALAIATPVAGAAALMRRVTLPSFAQLIGPAAWRVPDPLKLALGSLLILLCVFAIQSALGLVFDPRYRDFPFAPMTAALVPFLVLSVTGPQREGRRGRAETVAAALLAGSAIYIAFDESFANWQALWLCAVFLGLALTLWRLRDAQSSG
jgi:exo-beta-1,3-glucanase (GH17 family)